jgi:hypothetical protein
LCQLFFFSSSLFLPLFFCHSLTTRRV